MLFILYFTNFNAFSQRCPAYYTMASNRSGRGHHPDTSADAAQPADQTGRPTSHLGRVNRRELLGTGTVVGISGLAGCASPCPQEFEAPLAVIPTPRDFGLQNRQPRRLEIEREVMIVRDRTVINYPVVYEPTDRGAVASVGILSTPRVSCLGQTLNPLVTREFRQLLTDSRTRTRFVNIVAPQATTTDWQKGPTTHDTWSGTLFDQPVSVAVFTGIVGDPQDTLHAVFIAMARHTAAGEAVLVGAGTATELSSDVSPAGVSVVPSAVSQAAVDDIKQLTLGVLPEIEKRALPTDSTDGYGFSGYGEGGYGGVSG